MYLFLPWMVLLNLNGLSYFTFHNVSISTHFAAMLGICVILYIPQCIYFYTTSNCIDESRTNFTFHNVSISTDSTIKSKWEILLYIPQCIYFYSAPRRIWIVAKVALHSTMYLFLHFLPEPFKFIHHPLHSTMYLFLRDVSGIRSCVKSLYIPQCIYFYSSIRPLLPSSRLSLHSTMYLFLPSHTLCTVSDVSALHSTMYLFLLSLKSINTCSKSFTFHNVSISTRPVFSLLNTVITSPCFVDSLPHIDFITNLYL